MLDQGTPAPPPPRMRIKAIVQTQDNRSIPVIDPDGLDQKRTVNEFPKYIANEKQQSIATEPFGPGDIA